MASRNSWAILRNNTSSIYHGLYYFLQKRFGLKNTLLTFQMAIKVKLLAVKWPSVLMYLEEIVIISQRFINTILRSDGCRRYYKAPASCSSKKALLLCWRNQLSTPLHTNLNNEHHESQDEGNLKRARTGNAEIIQIPLAGMHRFFTIFAGLFADCGIARR